MSRYETHLNTYVYVDETHLKMYGHLINIRNDMKMYENVGNTFYYAFLGCSWYS